MTGRREDPAAARAKAQRLTAALRGDPEAIAEIERKYESGIDPIDLDFLPDTEVVAADRSSAAKKAWATRRAAGWVHPRSRGA